jgi:alanyl aminopeptidase
MQRAGNNQDSEQQLLHSELLSFMALSAKDPEARQQLLQQAHAFTGYKTARDAKALDADLYESAVTVAMQDSAADFLPHLLKVRDELDDPLFKNASANAIGRSQHATQLQKIHQLALSEQLDPSETFGLIQRALAEPTLQQQHWQWLQENFEAVLNKVPEQWRRNTPAFANAFCDKEKLQQLQQLFARNGKKAAGHQRSLAQAEEQIQLCIAQREKGQALLQSLTQ